MEKIRNDNRHNIVKEFIVYNITKRVYRGWVMNTVNLNESDDIIFRDLLVWIDDKYLGDNSQIEHNSDVNEVIEKNKDNMIKK